MKKVGFQAFLDWRWLDLSMLTFFGLVIWGMVLAIRRWPSFYTWAGLSGSALIALLLVETHLRVKWHHTQWVQGSQMFFHQPSGAEMWWNRLSASLMSLGYLALGISIVGICCRLQSETTAGGEGSEPASGEQGND